MPFVYVVRTLFYLICFSNHYTRVEKWLENWNVGTIGPNWRFRDSIDDLIYFESP